MYKRLRILNNHLVYTQIRGLLKNRILNSEVLFYFSFTNNMYSGHEKYVKKNHNTYLSDGSQHFFAMYRY